MNSLLSSRLYDNNTFYKVFKKDLQNAQHSVLIKSPFITARRINDLLPVFRSLRRRGVNMIVNTRNSEEHDEEYARQARLAVHSMQKLGITVPYTVKHRRKLAIIDGETLGEGSLNLLSQSDGCEIMRRIETE